MKYIFIDESGDLGFNFSKKGTSRYFMITCLYTDSPRPVEKLVRETHKNLRKKYKIRGTLHAVSEEYATRVRFCKKIAMKDCRISMIYLDKHRFSEKNFNKHQLYAFLMSKLLERLIHKDDEFKVVTSRRETSRSLNYSLKDYLYKEIKIIISIKTSQEEKCLQAIDILSWSLFRKYEYGDNTYSHLIKPIIEDEYKYL